jgi:hypothetical protein
MTVELNLIKRHLSRAPRSQRRRLRRSRSSAYECEWTLSDTATHAWPLPLSDLRRCRAGAAVPGAYVAESLGSLDRGS